VLLIDDDGDVNRFLSNRLEKCGLDVKYASDVQQGFRIARDGNVCGRRRGAQPGEQVFVLSGRQLNSVTTQNLHACAVRRAEKILWLRTKAPKSGKWA
jgi:hypothetical protein